MARGGRADRQPEPDPTPLTNGYRRAPVMRIGADVYRDTLPILRETERRRPEPSLYPGGRHGLARALGYWVERTTFVPAAALATSVVGDQLPAEFIKERKASTDHDFGEEASLRERPLGWMDRVAALGHGAPRHGRWR